MSEIMSRQRMSFNRQTPKVKNPFARAERERRQLQRALSWSFNDGAALSATLQEYNHPVTGKPIERDERTCQRWMAGQNQPREDWLRSLLLELAILQTQQQITARKQFLEEVGR